MKISKEEVMYVAGLARLDVDNASVDSFADQLGKILEYIETLNSINTEGVPAMFHAISITNAFREDIEGEHLENEKVLANAPDAEEGNFLVPKIIES